MHISDMETFCRTVQTGSVTAAARALNITKSVASRRLKSMEERYGVRLLVRSTRGVSPTEEGQILYSRLAPLLRELEEAGQALKGSKGPLVGRLRLTAPRAFSDLILSKALTGFASAHPNLQLDMQLEDTNTDITAGGYDMGLRIAVALSPLSLVAKKLATFRRVVLASPAYLAAHGTPETPEELAHHKAIFYSNVDASLHWRFFRGNKPVTVAVTGQIMCNSGQLQVEAAKAGLGVAFLPDFFAKAALADGSLIEILPDAGREAGTLWAMYPDRNTVPQKVRKLVQYLEKWFAENKDI